MITTFLRVNQLFISVILFILGLGGIIMINFNQINSDDAILSVILLCIQVLFMSIFNQKNEYLSQSNFALFFFILFSIFLPHHFSDISFYSGLFILNIIFYQILESKNNYNLILNPFDISFLGLLMIAIHPPFIPFLFVIIFHYILMGKTQTKSLILSLLGFFTAMLLIAEIIFISDRQDLFLTVWNSIKIQGFVWNEKYYILFPILLIVIFSLIDYLQNINRQKAYKKVLFANLFLILICSVIYLVWYGTEIKNFMVLAVPFSLLLTNFSLYKNSLKSELAIWVVLICLILFRYIDKIQLPESLNMISF